MAPTHGEARPELAGARKTGRRMASSHGLSTAGDHHERDRRPPVGPLPLPPRDRQSRSPSEGPHKVSPPALTFRRPIVCRADNLIPSSRPFGLCLRQGARPSDLVSAYDVVRVAGQRATTDGRTQGDPLPIVSHTPLRGTKRSRDFLPAPTTAQVDHSAVWDRDVDDAVLQGIGDELDESRLDLVESHTAGSSLTRLLPSSV